MKYDFPTWMDDVVRCPLLDNSTAPDSSHTHRDTIRRLVFHLLGSSPEALGDSSNSTTTHNSGVDTSSYPFPSTTTMYIIVAAQCLVFAILILFRFHGLALYKADEESLRVRRVRSRSQRSTDNRWWIVFFICKMLELSVAAAALQVHTLSNNKQNSRIVTLLSRAMLGTSLLVLTFSINFQRLYRHKDYAKASINRPLQTQAALMNGAAFALFLLFIAGEFVASHLISIENTTRTALYWAYICVLVLMMAPAWLATVWVCLHQAEIQPTRKARAILFAAMLIYFLSMFPPTFWNGNVLRGFTHSHPCPLKVMSFFDITLAVNFVAYGLIMIFVVLEYNRNKMLEVAEHFYKCSASLNDTDLAHNNAMSCGSSLYEPLNSAVVGHETSNNNSLSGRSLREEE